MGRARTWASAVVWCFGVCFLLLGSASGVSEELPDAPGFGQAAAAPQAGTATVTGVVLDIGGAVVAGAQVAVTGVDGKAERTTESDAEGRFRLENVLAGVVRVTVTAKGLETFVSNDVHLSAGERYELPRIDLPVAPANSTLTVTVTEDQLATEQVKEQEQQRVVGIFPNFYTSYLWNAAPMRTKQKFHLALKATTDPVIFLTVGIRAGVEQVRNRYPGYGGGAQGFFERYGAAYGDSVTGRFIGGAILPSVLRQDPRYFYKGTGSVRSRAWYAIKQTLICRGDNGKTQPNVSHVAGNFAAAALSNVYRAPEDRKAGLTLQNGALITGLNAISNLVREFLPRDVTSHVPDYKKGQPEGSAGE